MTFSKSRRRLLLPLAALPLATAGGHCGTSRFLAQLQVVQQVTGITLPVESRWVCFFSEGFPICMVYVTKMSFLLLYTII